MIRLASALITANTSKCSKSKGAEEGSGSNSGGSTTTGSGNSGTSQSTVPILFDEIKKLVLAQRKSASWNVGAPTGSFDKCPDGWIYNGKSKCFKYMQHSSGDTQLDVNPQSICGRATSTTGPVKMGAGDATLLKFEEDEDFVMLHYGLYTMKSM